MDPSAHLRSLYRSLLRELPSRSPNPHLNPTSLRKSIRTHFSSPTPTPTPTPAQSSSVTSTTTATHNQPPSKSYIQSRTQEASQFIQYLKAQRTYGFLLERYNPGMGMDEEERVRMTARRVGMEMPVEYRKNEG